MALVNKPNVLSIARVMMEELYANIRRKLIGYCRDRVIELGLSPRTSSQTYVIGSSLSESRKTVGKIKTLLIKHLIKLIPIVEHTQLEFFTVHDRQELSINLSDNEWRTEIEEATDPRIISYFATEPISVYGICGSSEIKRAYVRDLKEFKPLQRYVRYLNYMFRKYHVPLKTSVVLDMIPNESDWDTTSASISLERSKLPLRFKIISGIKFKFVVWSAPGSIETYQEAVETPGSNDAFFANDINWNNYDMIGSLDNSAGEFYRYSVEKLFLHMDKGIKILETLTRKAHYGSTAFSVGNR
jgi:hypothetical protein